MDRIDVPAEVARLLAGPDDPGEPLEEGASVGLDLRQCVGRGVVEYLALHEDGKLGMEQEESHVRLDETADRLGRGHRGHERRAHVGGEAGDAPAEDGVIQVLLVREVVVEQGAVELRFGGDVLDGGGGEPLAGKSSLGGVEQGVARRRGAADGISDAVARGRSRHGP